MESLCNRGLFVTFYRHVIHSLEALGATSPFKINKY
jgi:hypothetical protein